MTAPYWLPPHTDSFPDVGLALEEPNGLLAVGGDLSEQRLLNAYRHGIFPWYSDEQPILWWSPDPRLVLYPDQVRISRSLRKVLKKAPFEIRMDTAFADVILACAQPRPDQAGTWITDEMRYAYNRLHAAGFAHSVEAWQQDRLVGGLYGVALGRVFFGESMFACVSDASKVAFVHLCAQLVRWGFALIDCQVDTEHLSHFGAVSISRDDFVQQLSLECRETTRRGPWHIDVEVSRHIEETGDIKRTSTEQH